MDSSRPVIRSSEPSGPPSSLQDKDKFKQESKVPIAPKKVQVSVIVSLIISYTSLLSIWTLWDYISQDLIMIDN